MSEKRAQEIPTLLDERDRSYIEAMPNEQEREAALCVVTTYRRPVRLKIGEPIPALELVHLDNTTKTNLGAARHRPLVLFFGSYT
jgi:hypothetical protein